MPVWEGIEDASATASPVWLARTLKEDPGTAAATTESKSPNATAVVATGEWMPLRKVDCHALDAAYESWKQLQRQDESEEGIEIPATTTRNEVKVHIEGGRATAYLDQNLIRYNFNRGPVRELRAAVWFYRQQDSGGGGKKSNGGKSGGGRGGTNDKDGDVSPPRPHALSPVIDAEEAATMEELYQRVVQATSSRGKGLDQFLRDATQNHIFLKPSPPPSRPTSPTPQDEEGGGGGGAKEKSSSSSSADTKPPAPQFKIVVSKVDGKLIMRKMSVKTGIAGLFQSKPVDLQRGYGAYNVPGEDDEEALGPVRHLIFLIHGIGEAFFSREEIPMPSMIQEMNTARRAIYARQVQQWKKQCAAAEKEGLDVVPQRPSRVEIVLVEWFDRVHNSTSAQMKSLRAATVPSIPALRAIANDIVFDVCSYLTPAYCQAVLECVTKQINSIFEKFKEIHPDFIRNGGTCSLVGHSLGSVICWDLLALLKEDQEAHELNAKESMRQQQKRAHSVLSKDGSEQVLFSPDLEGLEVVRQQSEEDEKEEIRQREWIRRKEETAIPPQVPPTAQPMARNNSKDIAHQRVTVGPSLLYPLSQTLPFVPHATVFLGSPLGMFLTLRGSYCHFEELRLEQQAMLDQTYAEQLAQYEKDQEEQKQKAEENSSDDNNNGKEGINVDSILQLVKLGGGGNTGNPSSAKEKTPPSPPPPPPPPVVKTSPFTLPTDRLYNIYSPSDPVAYRIEPLLMDPDTPIPSLPAAQYLTPPGKDVRFHVKAKQISDEIANSWNTFFSSAFTARSSNSGNNDNCGSNGSNGNEAEAPLVFALGGKSPRVDFCLQPGVIDNEYFSAVTAHSSYFSNSDFQSFLMHIISEDEEPPQVETEAKTDTS